MVQSVEELSSSSAIVAFENRLDLMLYPALRDKYFFDMWKLPSQGEPYDSCGEVRAKAWCPDELVYKHDLLDNCDRAECPICSEVWARKAGKRITERMWNYRRLLKRFVRNTRLSHVTFSPPESEYRNYRSMRRRLYQVMKRAGVRGACVIFHAYRFRDAMGNEVAWKHCSLNPSAKWPVVNAIAVYSPHWHVISAGWLKPSDEIEDKTGWVYVKHGDLHTRDDVFYCASYLVSHMGLNESMQSITYIGECSYNRMVVDSEEITLEPVLCPDCEAHLELHYIKCIVIDGHPVEGWREPWHRKVVKRRWRLKYKSKKGVKKK